MKKAIYTWCFLSAIFLSSLSAIGQSYDESELQEAYMNALQREDIASWIDSDGDVRFEYNGHDYYISVDEEQSDRLRIVLMEVWPIESHIEAVEAAFACNEVNLELTTVKAFTRNDHVEIACESWMKTPREASNVIMSSIEAMEEGVRIFVNHM